MGKQISFYQTEDDEKEFLGLIFENGHSIVDIWGERLSKEEALNSKELSLFIILINSSIINSNYGYLEEIKSEAIQYSRELKKDNQIRLNRLWIANKYFDVDEQQKNKSKEFNDMYDFYVKWIKKNYIKCDTYNYISKKTVGRQSV